MTQTTPNQETAIAILAGQGLIEQSQFSPGFKQYCATSDLGKSVLISDENIIFFNNSDASTVENTVVSSFSISEGLDQDTIKEAIDKEVSNPLFKIAKLDHNSTEVSVIGSYRVERQRYFFAMRWDFGSKLFTATMTSSVKAFTLADLDNVTIKLLPQL